MKELICIVCPRGCHLQVDEANGYAVTGNACPRGADYAVQELNNPTRSLTSPVVLKGGLHRRLPVRTSCPIPKGSLMAVMSALDQIQAEAPVQAGQVLLSDICGTGADLIATRNAQRL